MYLSIDLSSIWNSYILSSLSINLSIHSSIFLSIYLSIYLSIRVADPTARALFGSEHLQERPCIETGLKELYTSMSTLAQKLVLTLLNHEFISKILNSTPFGRKICKHFRPKNHKKSIFRLIE